MNSSAEPQATENASSGGLALHWRILIGLLFGAVSGLIANATLDPELTRNLAKNWIEPIGQVFLRLILMVVVPLVFCALVLGVAGIGDVRRLGRLGLRTFLFTLIFSVASVVIGLVLTNVIQPGSRLSEDSRERLRTKYVRETDKAKEIGRAHV